jgi:hypothetical protein
MGGTVSLETRKKLITYASIGQGFIIANRFAVKLFSIYSEELKARNF